MTSEVLKNEVNKSEEKNRRDNIYKSEGKNRRDKKPKHHSVTQ